MLKETLKRYRKIDVLINNASVVSLLPVEEIDDAECNESMGV